MLFSNTIDSLPLDICIENIQLESVSSIKFLGVHVDNKLSWKSHIDNICKTISRNIGIINRLKTFIPVTSLLTLYSSLILPYLNYGILVWGNTHQNLLNRILLLQKKALRIISFSHPRSHTDPLFLDYKFLKIQDSYLFQLGQFMYNYKNEMVPSAFHDMFLQNNKYHKYPTRHGDNFNLPMLKTIFAQSTFIFSGPKFWNSLDKDIQQAPSINSFKRKLKVFLLLSYKRN